IRCYWVITFKRSQKCRPWPSLRDIPWNGLEILFESMAEHGSSNTVICQKKQLGKRIPTVRYESGPAASVFTSSTPLFCDVPRVVIKRCLFIWRERKLRILTRKASSLSLLRQTQSNSSDLFLIYCRLRNVPS